MPYSKFYPTITYKKHHTPFNRSDVEIFVARIGEHLPESRVMYYMEYEKDPVTSGPICTYNIVFVPYDSLYDVHSKFDFHAFRICLRGCDLSMSCWLSVAVDLKSSLNYHRFDNQSLEELWDRTKTCFNDDSRESKQALYLNYLTAVDVITDYYAKLKKIIGVDGFDEIVIDQTPLSYLLNFDGREYPSTDVFEDILEIIKSSNKYNLPAYNNVEWHRMAVSRYPTVAGDIQSYSDVNRLRSKTIDEFVSTWLLRVQMAVRGLSDYIIPEAERYGESFSALYKPLSMSRFKNETLEVELIAALWKALDSNSLSCHYETFRWGDKVFMRSLFSPGINFHPLVKIATMALAVLDEWTKASSEDGITRQDLDQLLSVIAIPTSLLYRFSTDGFDLQFIDIPSDNTTTLLSANNAKYTSLVSSLIRLKYFNSIANGDTVIIQQGSESMLSYLPLTSFYNEIRKEIRSIINVYREWNDWYFNPIVNHCFHEAFAHKDEYVKTWTERATQYLSSAQTDKALAHRLSSEAYRISMMSSIITDDTFIELRKRFSQNSREYQILEELNSITFSNHDCGISIACFAKLRYWVLYVSLYVEANSELAQNAYFDLTHFANVQPEDSIKELFDGNGKLKESISSDSHDRAKLDIVNLIKS